MMIELLTNNLELLLSAIGLVGGTGLVTLRFTRKQAEAKAMKAVQEVYQDTIKDLREDKRILSVEMEVMRESILALRRELDDMVEEVRLFKKDRCTVRGCSQRIRK